MLSPIARIVCVAALFLAAPPGPLAASEKKSTELVDINQASLAELMQVPGMTAVWAGRIVRFRPYQTKLDLLEKGVVPAEVYQRIREGVVAHKAPQKK